MTAELLDHCNRVLVVGDLHGNVSFASKVMHAARRHACQVIVQVGDFGLWDHEASGVYYLNWWQDRLVADGSLLIFVDGNHENHDRLEDATLYPVDEDGFRRVRPRIWHAPRGTVFTLGASTAWPRTFMAMGGAHSIDGPHGIWQQARGPVERHTYNPDTGRRSYKQRDLGNWWPQETITDAQVEDAKEVVRGAGSVDVVVAHDCPDGVQLPGIEGYPAADANRSRLGEVVRFATPELVVCGHYHLRHTAWLENRTRIEVLSADINASGQAVVLSLDSLRVEDVSVHPPSRFANP